MDSSCSWMQPDFKVEYELIERQLAIFKKYRMIGWEKLLTFVTQQQKCSWMQPDFKVEYELIEGLLRGFWHHQHSEMCIE